MAYYQDLKLGRNDDYKPSFDISAEFIDYINDKFEEMQQNAENKVATGGRYIHDLEMNIQGAWIMNGCKFDYKFRIEEYNPDGLPFGDRVLTFAIWVSADDRLNECGPVYEWRAEIIK